MEVLRVVPGTYLEELMSNGVGVGAIADAVAKEAGYEPGQVKALLVDIPEYDEVEKRPTEFIPI